MLWENQAADRIIRLKIYPLYIENRQPFSSRIDLLCKNKQSRRRAGADIESSSAPFHRSRSLDNYILKGESSFLYIYIYIMMIGSRWDIFKERPSATHLLMTLE